jgi:hypothetical protein
MAGPRTFRLLTSSQQSGNIHNNNKLTNLGNAGRAPSLRVISWFLPYN